MISLSLATTANHLAECSEELGGLDVLEVGCGQLQGAGVMSWGLMAQLLIFGLGAVVIAAWD